MATSSPRTHSTYLWTLATFALVVAILYFAKPVIVPLALSVLLTFVLTPVVTAFQQLGLKRIPAVLVTTVLAFLLIGFVSWIVGLQVNRLAQELPTHRKEIDEKMAGLRGAGKGPLAEVFQMFSEISKGEVKNEQTVKLPAAEKVVVVQTAEPNGLEQVAGAMHAVVEPLAQAGLIAVLVIFMLIKREDLRNRVIALLGHGRLTGTTRVLVDAAHRVSRFLLAQMLINVAFGVVFAIGLYFIGVPYAFLWGFLAVLLRFVPYIGAWIALAMPLILSFAMAPDWTQPILVVAWFSILEVLTANVVEPLWFGHGTGVSPIALLVAAAFWTWIWGPIGLVLATPLTVCLVTLGQHMPRLRFFAMLLGDQPALLPHAQYYQRLLARDEPEAKQIAIEYAQTNGLENVYDDVLLPALKLVHRDRKVSGLGAEDEGFILRATLDILNDLQAQPTVAVTSETPAAGAAPALSTPVVPDNALLVLGCPAHHEAEALSVLMLAQLLGPHGMRVETVSTKVLPTEIESRIANEAPALVFIAMLHHGLVQARYLCKRLRKRFPNLPIVVGYWGNERNYDKVLVRARTAGASYMTTSLLQTRTQIKAILNATPAAASNSVSIVPATKTSTEIAIQAGVGK